MNTARTLPPVGDRVPVVELIRAIPPRREAGADLVRDLARRFGVRYVFPLSSGKAALSVIFRALRSMSARRKVILPAYTCYSVPSAIVKAGLIPVPCDVSPGSFDYDYEQLRTLLGPDVLCALSVHLFGIPADTMRLIAICRPAGIYVVEDAAQALDVPDGGPRLGTRGDAGVFSLGRGKNITCGSGGVVVSNSERVGAAIRRVVNGLPRSGAGNAASAFAGLALLSCFIRPGLYWLPAGLPFLRLGETIFYEDFPVQELSPFQARLLRNWHPRLERLNARRREVAAYYLHHVHGALEYGKGVPYLRFPLLLDPDIKQSVVHDAMSRRLGISAMYPATVGHIPQLRQWLSGQVYPRAEEIAARLVTLPTHGLLTRGDLNNVCSFVNAAAARQRQPARVIA